MDRLSVLWRSFTKRVSTIYLPDKKRPMLPTILSDCLCSLQEKSATDNIYYGYAYEYRWIY